MIVAHDATGQPAKIRLQSKEARQIRRNHDCKHRTIVRTKARARLKERSILRACGNQESTLLEPLRIFGEN
jgi:transposase